MVKLIASLLAVTLATGSAIASSNKYQRHSILDVSNQMQPHGPLQEHDQERVVRRPRTRLRPRIGIVAAPRKHARAFKDDDLEAREPLRVPAGTFKGAAKKGKWRNVASGTGDVLGGVIGIAGGIQDLKSRSLDDDEDLFGREPFPAGSRKGAVRKPKWENVVSGTEDVLNGVNTAVDIAGGIKNMVQSRGLENDEDLFEREPFPAGSLKGAKKKPNWENVASGAGDVLSGVDSAIGIAGGIQNLNSRSFEYDEDLFGREPSPAGSPKRAPRRSRSSVKSPNSIRAQRINALAMAAQNGLNQWGLLNGRDTFDDLD